MLTTNILVKSLQCVEKVDKRKRLTHNQRSVESIVRCMQDHSPQNITRAARKISTPTFLSRFAPIVDGQVYLLSYLNTLIVVLL